MGCNCKMTEGILAILILVFTYWTVPDTGYISLAIVTISAVILLIHSFMCTGCAVPKNESRSAKKRR